MHTVIPKDRILGAQMDFAVSASGLCYLGALRTILCDFGKFLTYQAQVISLSACPGLTWPTPFLFCCRRDHSFRLVQRRILKKNEKISIKYPYLTFTVRK